MKKTKWIRLTAMMLAVVVLMAGPFGGAALAADDETYREFKPSREIPSTPQWEQQEVTCQSGDNTFYINLGLLSTQRYKNYLNIIICS